MQRQNLDKRGFARILTERQEESYLSGSPHTAKDLERVLKWPCGHAVQIGN